MFCGYMGDSQDNECSRPAFPGQLGVAPGETRSTPSQIDVGSDGGDLVPEAGEVGGEDGRRKAHRLLHRSEHTQVN